MDIVLVTALWITGSVLMIIFQDRQSINVNETSNELQ